MSIKPQLFSVVNCGVVFHTICSFLPVFEGVNLLVTCKDMACAFPWRSMVQTTIAKGKLLIDETGDAGVDFSVEGFFDVVSKGLQSLHTFPSYRPAVWNYLRDVSFLEAMCDRLTSGLQPVTKHMCGTDSGSFRIGLLSRLFVAMFPWVSIICARCKKGMDARECGRHLIIGRLRIPRGRGDANLRAVTTKTPHVYFPVQRALGFAALNRNSYAAHTLGSTIVPCLCQECATVLATVVYRGALMGTEDVLFMGDVKLVPVTALVGTLQGARSFSVSPMAGREGTNAFELSFSDSRNPEIAKRLSGVLHEHLLALSDKSQAILSVENLCHWLKNSFIPLYVDQLLIPVWNVYIGNKKANVLPGALDGESLVLLRETNGRMSDVLRGFSGPDISDVLLKTELPSEYEIISLVHDVIELGRDVSLIAKARTDRFGMDKRDKQFDELVKKAQLILLGGGMTLLEVTAVLSPTQALRCRGAMGQFEVHAKLTQILTDLRSMGIWSMMWNTVNDQEEDYRISFQHLERVWDRGGFSATEVKTAITPVPECPIPFVRNIELPPPIAVPVFIDPAVGGGHDEDADALDDGDDFMEDDNPFMPLFENGGFFV